MKKLLIGLVSVATIVLMSAPALASGSDIKVENNNSAYVKNDVNVGANTGWNVTAGGDGGSGGGSGTTKAYGGSTATGGDANGGNGGENSGDITTGDATAKAKVVNVVNTNKTKIEVDCDCANNVDDVKVRNNNQAKVKNYVGVGADSGNNAVWGGLGGDAGNSGYTKASGNSIANGGDANGGNGGANSGDIKTGDAYGKAKVVNIVNKNITKIRR